MIEMGKRYQTRDGQAVEILRTNVKNAVFPIVGIITHADGSETQDRWKGDGGYDSYRHPLDLVPVPTKHEGWMPIARQEDGIHWTNGAVHTTKEEAISYAPSDGIVIAHVTWES